MNLIEAFLKDNLFIDFGAEIMYGEDQCGVAFPCRFPTVGFQLMATSGLSQIADRIRKDLSFKPMHPMDEYTDESCDSEGFYDFYIGINDAGEVKADSCIEFVVANSDSPDTIERAVDAVLHVRVYPKTEGIILLSAHREENIDTEKNFTSLFTAINALAEKYDMPILYSCHPRSKKRLETSGFKLDPRVRVNEPLGFNDYNKRSTLWNGNVED